MSTPQTQIPDFDTFVASRGAGAASPPHRARSSAPSTQLPPVDPRLDSFVQNVMGDASARTGYTYKLGEGSRTPEQQAGKVAAGYSRTYNSKHLSGRGRDVLAFDSEGRYITDGAHEAYKALGDVYRQRAPSAGVSVKWGGDFKDFYDPGHFEIEDGDAAAPAPSAEPPDFDTFVASRDIPYFDTFVAQRAQVGDDEVISTEAAVEGATGKSLALTDPRRRQKVDSSTVHLPASQSAPAPARPEPYDVRTMEGRQARDARAAAERSAGAYLDAVFPVSDITKVDAREAVREMYKRAATARGVPAEFFDAWQRENNPHGYRISDRPGGEELTAADAYDEASKGLLLRLDARHVSQIVDDYKASRGSLRRLSDWATSDETSAGEKLLGGAGAVAAPVVKGAGYVARPFQAASAGVFSALRGHNPLPVAYDTLTTGETPAEGTNPVGNYLRDSAVLNRINPRLGRLLGGAADVVLDPANLIGLGILGKGAKAIAGAGRLGRAAEEVNALGRSLGFLERGLVESRPLGLEAAAASDAGRVASLEDHLSRVLEVTRKLKAGERLTPEEAALHAEVKAAAESAPSAAVRGEQLNYARERAAHYEEVARTAKSEGARRAARELADDYANEATRLEGGAARAASAEGYDVADAAASCFSPDVEGPRSPLWRRALRNTKDVAQLPKVKAGFDLSATGRQALPQIMAHPSYFKQAMAEQLKAFASEDAFNEFVRSIRNRPDFELMNESGLFLSGVGPEAEEAFASGLSKKIPGVRASDRAYSAALDAVRVQAWETYTRAVAGSPHANADTYKAIAELVNISTGRGVIPILDRSALGKKVIDLLNVPFFSPRNTASKFNLLSPRRFAANLADPATRPVALLQMRDAARGVTTLGTTMGLLYLAGLDVTANPFSKDFGKLRVGKAVYDLTGGEGYTVRYLAQMARSASDLARGRRVPKAATPRELTRRYLRSQLQPLASGAVDVATGKTFEGKPTSVSGAALDLIVPFVVDDVIKGFKAEGWLGGVKAAPGVLGVGVNFYDKSKEERGPRSAPESPEPEPSPSATPAPQLDEPSEPDSHEEISRAVDSADGEGEPTFRPFPEAMRGESSVPRSVMPQIKGEHRGAMVQYLKGRGITHRMVDVPAGSLKPSQADYSPEKVARARGYRGPERRILISSDGHVADGHHQWLSKLHEGAGRIIPAIELDAPILPLLLEMARFPSSGVDDASARAKG